jgi:hypothetical protein
MAGRHARDYYEVSAPRRGSSVDNGPIRTRRAGCPTRGGNPQVVPTFTMRSIDQLGARLYPGSIVMATPQAFTMTSPPTELNGFGVQP